MRESLRSRVSKRGGIVGLLALVVLALMPVAPATAAQTIGWITTPPTTAVVGQQVSFAWTGTANTFLGARITGCFATFPDGGNYSSSFGGNFTIGNCNTTKTLTIPGNYTITVGFDLSTGGPMTQSRVVTVGAPTPTVSVPSPITTTATSVEGAVVTFSASAADSYYGASSAICAPASGSVFPVGTNTVTCSATNPGGKTGSASFPVTVDKANPTLLWSPPSPVTYGTTYGDLMTAEMQAADATGTITYSHPDGTRPAPGDLLPAGADQALIAGYEPSGPAASAYNSVAVARTITVERAASAVAFASGTPTSAQYGDAPFSVDAAGTVGAGGVTVSAEAGSTCTVDSPSSGTSVTATVTITGAGDCVLLADQAATDQHTAAPTAQWSVTASKANPQITWTPPSVLTYGDPVSDLLDATADVPGTMTYLVDGIELAPETVLDAGVERSVSVVFTPDLPADYTDATTTRTFTVTPAQQTLTVGTIGGQTFGATPFDLDIDGTGPGAISATATGSCTVDELTVTVGDVGECEVTVAKAATSNYLAAESVTRTFSVDPAEQTLSVGEIDDQTFGATPFDLDIDGTGPGAISATATGACTVDELTVTVGDVGECEVTVAKAATSNYLAAESVTRTFAIAPAPVTPTPTNPTNPTSPTPNVPAVSAPVIAKVSANSGPTKGKKAVTIIGAGFTGATSVKFGTVAAKFTVKNSTTIVATSPRLKVGTYDIRVTTAHGTSGPVTTDRYTVRPIPKIKRLSVKSGSKAGKKSVTIRGTGFTGATRVKFGRVAVKFKVKNKTTIVVTSPRLKKGKHHIRVTTSGGTSAKVKADRYTVK